MALPPRTRYSLNFDAHTNSSSGGVDIFQDALKKMDSVIGGIGVTESTSTFGHGGTQSQIASLCQQLQSHIIQQTSESYLDISTETRHFLISWLTTGGGDHSRGSPYTSQLQSDKDTLLQQIQTLERNIEIIRTENDNLKKELQGKSGVHYRTNSGNVTTLPPSTGGPLYDSTNISRGQVGRTTSLTALTGGGGGSLTRNTSSSSGLKRQRSFRESFRKAFSRKGNNGKDINLDGDPNSKLLNTRAVQFVSLNGPELASWMDSIGLEMYSELISQLVVTGERLASIAANTEDLVRLGVINILHCKKLKLAVEDAVTESPSVLSYLDHNWVADWLVDIGLPQYQQPFLDAKIDGRMLNSLSMEDLAFLNIEHPFHILSMKRAIQAFRLCGYDSNYLKLRPNKGGFKLFNWSSANIIDWMRDIELDEYADKLHGTGISGPIVALEPSFTHESIAKAVGIAISKSLIIAHLGEKFLLLIGPTCAQRKVDAMQIKHFVPMNPLDQPIKGKHRKTSKRKQAHHEETFLCPPSDVPSVTQSDNSYYNLTVSSDTGQRRSVVYSPSPRSHSPICPTPPLIHHTSTSHLLTSYSSGNPAPVPPPVAPVPPPVTHVPPPVAPVPPPPPPPPLL